MKLVSVNCGLPREVLWRGQKVTTSIYKEPIHGRIALLTLNLDSDEQSDLTVHGGKEKAVYCYPIEYYSYWRTELPGRSLPYGSFRENFSVEGLVQEGLARICSSEDLRSETGSAMNQTAAGIEIRKRIKE